MSTIQRKSFLPFIKVFTQVKSVTYLFWFVLVSLSATVFEGAGIALFFPLLNLLDNSSESIASNDVGRLAGISGTSKIVHVFEMFSLEYTLQNTFFFIVIIFTLKGALQFFQTQMRNGILSSTEFYLRYRWLNAISKIQYSEYERLVNQRKMLTPQEFVAASHANGSLITLVIKTFNSIGFITISLIHDWKISSIGYISTILIGVSYIKIFKNTSMHSQKHTTEMRVFDEYFVQAIAYFKYLKATNAFNFFKIPIQTVAGSLKNRFLKIGRNSALIDGFQNPALALMLCAVLVISVKWLGMPVYSVLISLALIYKTMNLIMSLQGEIQSFLTRRGVLEVVLDGIELIESCPEKIGDEKIEFIESIRLENLKLSIGNKLILDGISIDIKKNEFIAIVGRSGSGKSTLMELMCGLRFPDEGKIKIDGKPLRYENINSWRNKIGYVNQDFAVFTETISNNIIFGHGTKDEKLEPKVLEAIHQAGASSFVNSLADGVNTVIRDRTSLSVGQKQRIAIARELFKNFELLLLDEATSALDPESERLIEKTVLNLHGKKTVIMVTHRQIGLEYADRIMVLDQGKLVEVGSYNELKSNPNSLFNLLFKSKEKATSASPRFDLPRGFEVKLEVSESGKSFEVLNISQSGLALRVLEDFKASLGKQSRTRLCMGEKSCFLEVKWVHQAGNVVGVEFVSPELGVNNFVSNLIEDIKVLKDHEKATGKLRDT